MEKNSGEASTTKTWEGTVSRSQVVLWGAEADEYYAGEVQRSYVICSHSRTGSYLLCAGLQAVGVAGKPTEYFHFKAMPMLAKRWNVFTLRRLARRIRGREIDLRPSDFKAYVEKLLQWRTGPNGVFGTKLHYDQFEPLGRPDLESVFPNLRYVCLFRRDRARQAVSMVKAQQTNKWISRETSNEPTTLRYDFEAIFRQHARFIQEHIKWERYFAERNIQPLRIVYEDFVANYEATIRQVLEYLEIEGYQDVAIPPPPLKKQADALSEQWLRRYNQDLQNYGLALCEPSQQQLRRSA